MYIKRNITSYLKKMLIKFPVISITGPRQSGKTTLLKNVYAGETSSILKEIQILSWTDFKSFLKSNYSA